MSPGDPDPLQQIRSVALAQAITSLGLVVALLSIRRLAGEARREMRARHDRELRLVTDEHLARVEELRDRIAELAGKPEPEPGTPLSEAAAHTIAGALGETFGDASAE